MASYEGKKKRNLFVGYMTADLWRYIWHFILHYYEKKNDIMEMCIFLCVCIE